MAKDLPGFGTTLSINTAAAGATPPTWTVLSSAVTIDGPEPEVAVRDVTVLLSQYKAKRAGLTDLGKITGTLYFDPNDPTMDLLRARLYTYPSPNSGSTVDQFQLTYNDGHANPANDVFSGFITGFKPTGMEVEGTLEAEFSIELTDSFVSTTGH